MVICAFHNTIVEPVSMKNILTKDANKNRRKDAKDTKEKKTRKKKGGEWLISNHPILI